MRVPFKARSDVRRLAGAGLTALALLAAAPALAQTPPAAAAAAAKAEPSPAQLQLGKELLAANGEDQSFDSLIPGVIEQAAGSFAQANPDLIRDLRDVAKNLAPEFEDRKAQITDILARAYAERFTEAELKEMLAFYKTPVGKKLVETRPALIDQGLRGIQAWSARFAKEMEGRIRDEMKKRGYTI